MSLDVPPPLPTCPHGRIETRCMDCTATHLAGRIVFTAPPPRRRHRCVLPETEQWVDHVDGDNIRMEHQWLVTPGSVYRCGCGRLWEYLPPTWTPARWRTRLHLWWTSSRARTGGPSSPNGEPPTGTTPATPGAPG